MNSATNSDPSWPARLWGPESGLPVLLLHSIATSSQMWAPQIAPWSRHFRLIIPDLPGHGNTPCDAQMNTLEAYADGAVRLLDRLRLGKVAVVGLSLGGMIAQALALHHPQRLFGLVISNSPAQMSAAIAGLWEQRKQQARAQGMQSQVAATLARWFTPQTAALAPMTLDWVSGLISATAVEGYASAVGAIQVLDHQRHLARIETPTLVVAGSDDALFPPDAATQLAAQIPKATAVTITGAAHLANVEQPVAYTERVGAFLRGLPGPI